MYIEAERRIYMHCVDNGWAPGRHQAVIWTRAGILLMRSLGINFSEILIKIYIFSFKKMCRQEIRGHFVSTSVCQIISHHADPTMSPV